MYRWANNSDLAAIKKLWANDFEAYEPYFSWYFKEGYLPERTLCYFADNTLAAMLQLAPYKLKLRGAELPIHYYVGVVTDPAFRGLGLGHALLQYTEQWLRQKGSAAAFFYTDIPRYYQPLGYRHCYQLKTLQLADEALTELATSQTDGGWRHIDWRLEWPVLDAIYQKMIRNYEGCILRTAADWFYYLGEQECDGAQILSLSGQAYLVAVQNKETLRIMELGFAEPRQIPQALAAAARLAKSKGLFCLEWAAPADIAVILPQFAAAGWQTKPFVMARLLDWPNILQTIKYPPALTGYLDLTIADERHIFELKNGTAQIVGKPTTENSIELGIAALTQLVLGVPNWAEEEAALSTEQKKWLAECFPPLNTWINEYT